jgi:hypothetical protein
MLTYQDPQIKYWRNMKTESLNLIADWVSMMGFGVGTGKVGMTVAGEITF